MKVRANSEGYLASSGLVYVAHRFELDIIPINPPAWRTFLNGFAYAYREKWAPKPENKP